MGRISQLSWVLLLLVVLISVLVSAEQVLEESKEAVKEKTEKADEAVKSWKDWALHHSSNAYGSAKKGAGEYYTKSADSLYTGAGQARHHIGEFVNKWRSIAEEKAGNYNSNYKKKVSNPAAEAISSLNKGGEEDEL